MTTACILRCEGVITHNLTTWYGDNSNDGGSGGGGGGLQSFTLLPNIGQTGFSFSTRFCGHLQAERCIDRKLGPNMANLLNHLMVFYRAS